MTYDMVQTGLAGFPIQYSKEIVQHLNKISNSRTFNNLNLGEIGEAVSPDVKHTIHGETRDGYTWFGKLEYDVNGAKVCVMFPWSQDWDHPETQMDRSINVYSDRKLSTKVVGNLLEQIAYKMALKCQPKES